MKKPKVFNLSKADCVFCITDIFLDACKDHVDFISDKEIMHFLGVPDSQLVDMKTETSYDLRMLREKINAQDSCVIAQHIENTLLLH